MNTIELSNLNMTLLFVCASEETVHAALDAANARRWTVTQAAFDVYISSRRRPHLPDALKVASGSVALIDFDADPEQAAAAATYLHQVFRGHIIVMAVSSRTEPAFILAAMRAGCTEFLTTPLQAQALQSAFQGVEQQLMARISSPQATGSILALVGAKGGVGTTTLGVHLAYYLVQKNKKKVLLIDSKAQFGHVCIYLGMDGSECHFQEVVSNVNRLDSELLRAFVGKHSSGLDLLSSPDIGQVARPMLPEDVLPTLEFLRGEYDFVVVDCDDSTDEVTRAILTASSQVYLVATPDITAIRDLSRQVDDLARLDSATNIQVVINRYSSQFAVSLEDIEKAIRLPVSFSVPNDYVELVRSANLGVPVNADVKSGFTTELMKWTHSLMGTIAEEPLSKLAGSAKPRLWKTLKTLVSTISIYSPIAGKRT